MKVYAFDFNGLYPVGANAIVTAESPEAAAALLETQLAAMKLPQKIDPTKATHIKTNVAAVTIINDGDY